MSKILFDAQGFDVSLFLSALKSYLDDCADPEGNCVLPEYEGEAPSEIPGKLSLLIELWFIKLGNFRDEHGALRGWPTGSATPISNAVESVVPALSELFAQFVDALRTEARALDTFEPLLANGEANFDNEGNIVEVDRDVSQRSTVKRP